MAVTVNDSRSQGCLSIEQRDEDQCLWIGEKRSCVDHAPSAEFSGSEAPMSLRSNRTGFGGPTNEVLAIHKRVDEHKPSKACP